LNQAESTFRLPRWLEVLLGVVVLLELIAPFVTHTYGVDGRLHLNWIAQFTKLTSEGVWIPRWVPDGFFGFGASSFYFYPPFTFYVSALIQQLGGITNVAMLYALTSFLATIASFFTMRALLKSLGTFHYQRNIGGLLYAFAPLRLAELYSRSALSTHVAYAFIPCVWLGLVAISRRDSWRAKGILLLAVSSALLALTNLPTAIVTGICIGIAGIVWWRLLTRAILWDVILSGIIAAGLVAFHFLSVEAARPFAHLEDLESGDPSSLIVDVFHGGYIPAAYHAGLLYAALVLILYAYWVTRRKILSTIDTENIVTRIGIAITVFMLFLEIPYASLPLWRHLLIFHIVQFVWRFYCYGVLIGAVIVGVARSNQMHRAARGIVGIWTFGAVVPVILALFSYHVYPHFTRPLEDATEYLPVSFSFAKDSVRQLERVSGNGINSKFSAASKFDAIARTLQPHENEASAITNIIIPGEYIHLQNLQPRSEKLEVQFKDSHFVTFHRFIWPGWHLYANGKEISSQPDSIGRVTATLPKGHYTIDWQLEYMPLETAGLWISGVSWSSILVFLGIGFMRGRVKAKMIKKLP
jgi:hypothetical protein